MFLNFGKYNPELCKFSYAIQIHFLAQNHLIQPNTRKPTSFDLFNLTLTQIQHLTIISKTIFVTYSSSRIRPKNQQINLITLKNSRHTHSLSLKPHDSSRGRTYQPHHHHCPAFLPPRTATTTHHCSTNIPLHLQPHHGMP